MVKFKFNINLNIIFHNFDKKGFKCKFSDFLAMSNGEFSVFVGIWLTNTLRCSSNFYNVSALAVTFIIRSFVKTAFFSFSISYIFNLT